MCHASRYRFSQLTVTSAEERRGWDDIAVKQGYFACQTVILVVFWVEKRLFSVVLVVVGFTYVYFSVSLDHFIGVIASFSVYRCRNHSQYLTVSFLIVLYSHTHPTDLTHPSSSTPSLTHSHSLTHSFIHSLDPHRTPLLHSFIRSNHVSTSHHVSHP
jgi:hypothetical protein